MDGDLQNDPADIPMLLAKLAEGYDAVFGLRKDRQDHMLIRKVPSWLGNWLIREVTGVRVKDMGCTLRAMRRDLAEALPLYGEMHRFIPVLAQMHGAKLTQVEVRHHPRDGGQDQVQPDAHGPRYPRSDNGQVPAQLPDAADARHGPGGAGVDGAGRR